MQKDYGKKLGKGTLSLGSMNHRAGRRNAAEEILRISVFETLNDCVNQILEKCTCTLELKQVTYEVIEGL